MSTLADAVGQGKESTETIFQSGNWPRVQHYCLALTTYAAQHREAFGQHPSFMSSADRALARNGYEALLAEAQAEFPQASPEARYISDLAGKLVAAYSSGYGFK